MGNFRFAVVGWPADPAKSRALKAEGRKGPNGTTFAGNCRDCKEELIYSASSRQHILAGGVLLCESCASLGVGPETQIYYGNEVSPQEAMSRSRWAEN